MGQRRKIVRENPETVFWRDVFNFQDLRKPSSKENRNHNRQRVMGRLKAYGFYTGKAEMPELGLCFDLGEREAYARHVSQDVARSGEAFVNAYGIRNPGEFPVRRKRLAGLYLNVPPKAIKGEEYFIRTVLIIDPNKVLDAFEFRITWGHEDGHVLYRSNRASLVFDKFRVPGNIQEQLREEEDFCIFCGYAAYNTMNRISKRIQDLSLIRIPDHNLKVENARNETEARQIQAEILENKRKQKVLGLAKEVLL